MKVILLAAGIGSRLKPLTENTPKSLLKISYSETVIERTLNIINKNCKCEIIIVCGFNKHKFYDVVCKYNNCKIVSNPFFSVTNSISSLWFAKEYMDDEIIIINSDVIMEEELFKKVLSLKQYADVFYDSSIGVNADYKVAEQDGKVVVMSKELQNFSGEYAGITKFSREAAVKLKTKIETMVDNGIINEWYETALVDMIFNDDFKIEAIDVKNYKWTEIDSVNDLIKARKIFLLDEKYNI